MSIARFEGLTVCVEWRAKASVRSLYLLGLMLAGWSSAANGQQQVARAQCELRLQAEWSVQVPARYPAPLGAVGDDGTLVVWSPSVSGAVVYSPYSSDTSYVPLPRPPIGGAVVAPNRVELLDVVGDIQDVDLTANGLTTRRGSSHPVEAGIYALNRWMVVVSDAEGGLWLRAWGDQEEDFPPVHLPTFEPGGFRLAGDSAYVSVTKMQPPFGTTIVDPGGRVRSIDGPGWFEVDPGSAGSWVALAAVPLSDGTEVLQTFADLASSERRLIRYGFDGLMIRQTSLAAPFGVGAVSPRGERLLGARDVGEMEFVVFLRQWGRESGCSTRENIM